jgi:hypothetical protein
MTGPRYFIPALLAPLFCAFSLFSQSPPPSGALPAGDPQSAISEAVSPADYLSSLKRAADTGDIKAELNLGAAYAGGGPGLAPDPAEALKWYRKAADRGDSMGQLMVGHCYDRGLGVPSDLSEAARWFQKSADQGNSLAEMTLGMAFARGRGVQTNRVEAEKWLTKAADSGDPFPQYVLGLFYWGKPDAKDGDLAAAWLHKAADQGQSDAEFLLGECYQFGRGVNKDLAEAYKWQTLASRAPAGKKISDSLAHAVTSQQKAEGLRRAAAFQPRRPKTKIPGMPDSLPAAPAQP